MPLSIHEFKTSPTLSLRSVLGSLPARCHHYSWHLLAFEGIATKPLVAGLHARQLAVLAARDVGVTLSWRALVQLAQDVDELLEIGLYATAGGPVKRGAGGATQLKAVYMQCLLTVEYLDSSLWRLTTTLSDHEWKVQLANLGRTDADIA